MVSFANIILLRYVQAVTSIVSHFHFVNISQIKKIGACLGVHLYYFQLLVIFMNKHLYTNLGMVFYNFSYVYLLACILICHGKKIRDDFELNKIETTAHYNRWDVTKSLFRGIFIDQNDYNRKKQRSLISNLSFYT